MLVYYLAIDIGASSGRHILGTVENGRLRLQEVYRFENEMKTVDGALTWDVDAITNEVINGIAECGKIGKIPSTVAIDTWGVDYVLLDEDKRELLPVYAYRDARTAHTPSEVEAILSEAQLYAHTGIQKQNFNTVYQLYCDKQSGKLERAAHFLMMPEYLSFKLTGKLANEYTNATTTGLVNAQSKCWDEEILDALEIKKSVFLPLSAPSTPLGGFTEQVRARVGFDATVVLAPGHDTASAVAACPLHTNSAYISSGTWSLLGTELDSPIRTAAARAANFTNEGGVEYKIRFLKNIMGMWLLQNIRKNLNKKYSYDEMMHLARHSTFRQTVDVNAPEFVAPDNMIEAIRRQLNQPSLPIEDVISCVYHSLAQMYRDVIAELESITQKTITEIQIVGGGSADTYLNELTARYSGKSVVTGLKEATATGNLISQMMYHDQTLDLASCREIIKNSFTIQHTN